jgi:hypothetical protein
MQAQIANAALDHTIKQETVSDMLESKGATAEYLKARSSITDWTDPKQTGNLDAILAKNPTVPQWIVQDTRKREADAMVYDARLTAANTRAANAELYTSTKVDIANAQIAAQKQRLDAAIASREDLAKTNNEAKAEREVMRQNRFLLNRGKEVTWDEFFNRSLGTYVRSTGKTPEEAAPALRKLYDDFIAMPKEGLSGAPVDPKDPFGVFKP